MKTGTCKHIWGPSPAPKLAADGWKACIECGISEGPPHAKRETTLREQARVAYDAAYVAHRTCCHEAREVIYQALRTVEREALERAARACIEADETGCDTGQFYAKVVLSVSGDSTS